MYQVYQTFFCFCFFFGNDAINAIVVEVRVVKRGFIGSREVART